jgi:lambda repressor-like predicted transcriptional regulator
MVFVSRQLEFNATTNRVCLDRSVPKKKLSQADMLEIKPWHI